VVCGRLSTISDSSLPGREKHNRGEVLRKDARAPCPNVQRRECVDALLSIESNGRNGWKGTQEVSASGNTPRRVIIRGCETNASRFAHGAPGFNGMPVIQAGCGGQGDYGTIARNRESAAHESWAGCSPRSARGNRYEGEALKGTNVGVPLLLGRRITSPFASCIVTLQHRCGAFCCDHLTPSSAICSPCGSSVDFYDGSMDHHMQQYNAIKVPKHDVLRTSLLCERIHVLPCMLPS
jgi:hypothetical protein